ncbi:MAG TPA: MFS transporter [Candidatus Limnocylindrales bacterium]|nr:MFS transporter [Candidatus Limnocylindrales bacterium]
MARDVALIFAARVSRMAGYGAIAVVLGLYLAERGFDAGQVGLLFTLTLAGDAVISLWLATRADRFGRRRTLVIGAALLVVGGVAFAATGEYVVLLAAAIVSIISPSGAEVGPFLPVEQAALTEVVGPIRRTWALAWYQLAGSLATAGGALAAGLAVAALLDLAVAPADAYRVVILAYSVVGLVIAVLVSGLSNAVEASAPADPSIRRRLGLHRSQAVVVRLSALFALDAFAGGFVLQSLVAVWFTVRWGVEPALLGGIFFLTNVLAGLSGLVAARLAARFGLVETMVGTHIPSNLLLIAVPFMPSLELAIGVLLARFAISQMDVPTRQSYTMAVVTPDERSAAAGITGMARALGAAAAPVLATPLFGLAVLGGGLPFVLSGSLKISYDLLLWRNFRHVRPPEERP